MLYRRFAHLAEVAVDFQQYNVAIGCYKVLKDYFALLHVYAICRCVPLFPPDDLPRFLSLPLPWVMVVIHRRSFFPRVLCAGM